MIDPQVESDKQVVETGAGGSSFSVDPDPIAEDETVVITLDEAKANEFPHRRAPDHRFDRGARRGC